MNTIEKKQWGKVGDEDVYLFHFTNDNGVSVSISNFGSTIISILCPDKNGNISDIVLGFDDLEKYQTDHPYFGSTVGRFANRIARGKFDIDGIQYQLPVNNGPNCLHGGINGFHKRVWDHEVIENSLITRLDDLDGSEGFPGNLTVKVTYNLNNQNQLSISYSAETDKKTHINLTDHTYFNLSGCTGNVFDHELYIEADQITPIDKHSIPTGGFMAVDDTPFDFRIPTAIGKNIHHEQLQMTNGYDHNFVVNMNGKIKRVAEVFHPKSGRKLMVSTSEPGLQLYTGNGLGEILGKKGMVYKDYFGVCLETQHFPNSPNIPHFPTTLLSPDQQFISTTIYEFRW